MRWYSPRDWVEGEGEGEEERDQLAVNANSDPSLCREEKSSKFDVLSEPEGGGEGDGWEGEGGWGGEWDVIGEDDNERQEEEKVTEGEAEPAKKVDMMDAACDYIRHAIYICIHSLLLAD